MTITTGTKLVLFGFAMGMIAGAAVVRLVEAWKGNNDEDMD